MKTEDIDDFSFTHFFNYDIITYVRYALIGVKKYLLGDKDENIPKNQIMYHRFKNLDRIIKAVPFIIAFYVIFIKYDLGHVLKTYFNV